MATAQNEYNNISPELQALVKWPRDAKNKPVERVVYEWLRKTNAHVLNSDNERSRIDTFPGHNIPNQDTIFDRHLPGGGDYVQLAYFKTMRMPRPGTNETATPALLAIEFIPDNIGYLYVTRADLKLFQFLELMNANEDSVNPDKARPSMGYLFKRVKPEADAEDLLDLENEKMRVKKLVFDMDYEEMQALAPKVNINANQPKGQLQLALVRKVDEDGGAALVNNAMDGEAGKILADVQSAVTKKAIEYREEEGGFVWYETGQLFAAMPAEVVNKNEALATFLGSTKEGMRVREQIRTATTAVQKKSGAVPTIARPAATPQPGRAKKATPPTARDRRKGAKAAPAVAEVPTGEEGESY